MNRVLVSLLFAIALASAGCSRHYLIKLSNGGQITTASKPRLKGSSYYFKDAKGQVRSVPAGRVNEIEPLSMVKEEKSLFTPSTK